MSNFLKLIICIIICQLPGIIGSVFSTGGDPWYDALVKPAFTPPGWIFAPVWIALYFLMGISLFLVWKEDLKNIKVKNAFTIFIIQLVFNAAWAPVFFGAQSVAGGLIVILVLLILIILTLIKVRKVSTAAALLLIPYLLWVTFASILNLSIYILN